MPRGKKTKEEILKQQRLAKRRQNLLIKSDPNLNEEKKQKNRADYLKRRQNKNILSINEMNAREQRLKREKWRENSRKYRQKLAEEKNRQQAENIVIVEASTSIQNLENSDKNSNDPLNPCTRFRVKTESSPDKLLVKRIKYSEAKKREKLMEIIKTLKQKNKDLRQRLNRLKEKVKNSKEISYKYRFKNKSTINYQDLKSKQNKLLLIIQKFFEEDINSRIGSGKKEFITKNKDRRQKRYLNDNLKNLYIKFRAENEHLNISYSTFCRHRPFWVVFPKDSDRDTCMCELHSNMDLLVQALHRANIIKEKNSMELISSLCCSGYNYECITRKCILCMNNVLDFKEFNNNKQLEYYSWEKQKKEYITTDRKKKICSITTKVATKISPLDAIQKLNDALQDFFIHCFNISNQYKEIKKLKEKLNNHEALLHVDFSENFCIKFAQEVQADYYGGSRSQISLHTAVVYTHNFQTGAVDPMSVCTVSKCMRHDAPAIWAHLIPLIRLTLEKNPFVTTLYVLSDSPTSQYRNKYIFFMISQLCKDFPQIDSVIIWNYSEKGHGKGAPDGVGAVLKRTADAAVKFGKDVATFDDFIKILVKQLKNVIIMPVTEEMVEEKNILMPKTLTPFCGTLSVHQVLWKKDNQNITFRSLTCFSCGPGEICSHGFHIGFAKHLNRLNEDIQQPEEFVAPLVRTKRFSVEARARSATKGSRKYFPDDETSNKKSTINVLQDITLGADEMRNFLVSTYKSTPSTSKDMTTTYSINKENFADFEDLLEPKIVFKKPKK